MYLPPHFCSTDPAHAKALVRGHPLATFMGPQAGLSPRVCPDLARVPSWNCLMPTLGMAPMPQTES